MVTHRTKKNTIINNYQFSIKNERPEQPDGRDAKDESAGTDD